jgi:hypothetical protein
VAVGRNRRGRHEWRWNSRPETAMWAAVIIVGNPLNERAFQVSLGKWACLQRFQRPKGI